MPTYEFRCQNAECKHEWEDYLSIVAPDPEECPTCKAKQVLRLCSLGSKGVVELTGDALTDKIKQDVKVLKADAAKNEKVYANMLGEDKYQALQVRLDNQKKNKFR